MALYDVSTNEKKAAPSLVAGGTLYADSPIGTILPYGGATAPSGWFLCQGQAVSRTTYSELFAVIGTAFGAGDGSTTFNIPDMRESVPKGAGLQGLNAVYEHLENSGLNVGEYLNDRFQEHTHRYETNTSLVAGSQNQFIESAGGTGAVSISTIAEGRYGPTTEVKSVGVNYIIKAKMIGVPSDFMSAVDEAVEEKATRFPDYAHQITIPDGTLTWTATEDCYIQALYTTSDTTIDARSRVITINGELVGVSDASQGLGTRQFSGYVRKGQVVSSYDNTLNLGFSQYVKIFPLS